MIDAPASAPPKVLLKKPRREVHERDDAWMFLPYNPMVGFEIYRIPPDESSPA